MPVSSFANNAARQQAEAIAVDALAFIASDEQRLAAFMEATGLSPETLRQAAGDSGFLACVMQHLLSDEGLAASFACEHNLSPENMQRIAHCLGIDWG